jgi:branched-chain amino acid transport system substrate-binding protein
VVTGPLTHEGVPYTPYSGKFDRTFTQYFLLPLSGSGAAAGIRAQRAFDWAVEDTNAQGGIVIDGVRYKIQAQYFDTANNIQKAAEIANQVINQYSGKYAYVCVTSSVLATEDAFAQKNILVLAEAVPQPKTIGEKWPLQFSTVITPGTYSPTVYYPLFIKDFGVKNIALLNPDSDNGRVFAGIVKTTSQQLGLPINFVADEYFKPGSQDFLPLVNKMISLSPDFIDMPAAADGDVGLICKQMRDTGYKGLLGTTVFTSDPNVIWNIAGAASTGYFSLGYATAPTPKYAYITQAYLKQFNELMITPPISDYDSAIQLYKAINQANTFDTYKVANILQDMVWDGAFGSNTQYAGNEPGSIFGIKRFLKINVPMIRFTTNGNIEVWENGSW